MKAIAFGLRIICVSTGIVVVALETGPDLGRRAMFLGLAIGLVNWLFDVRQLNWVDKLVLHFGIVHFRRVFALLALVVLGAAAVVALQQDVTDRIAAMLLYMGAILVSGLGLSSLMVFLRLKQIEREARRPPQ